MFALDTCNAQTVQSQVSAQSTPAHNAEIPFLFDCSDFREIERDSNFLFAHSKKSYLKTAEPVVSVHLRFLQNWACFVWKQMNGTLVKMISLRNCIKHKHFTNRRLCDFHNFKINCFCTHWTHIKERNICVKSYVFIQRLVLTKIKCQSDLQSLAAKIQKRQYWTSLEVKIEARK